MKAIIFLFTSLIFVLSNQAAAMRMDPDLLLLSEKLEIYTDGKAVVNHPYPGFSKKILPTNNDYKGTFGCYVACYSHHKKDAVYSVGKNIYVIGQVRVPGHYTGRICIPTGFTDKDISVEKTFNALCGKRFKACKDNSCWVGGDTGGWFGIQAMN